MKNYLRLGDYNAICDSCGKKFKASQLQRRWDGLMVCSDDFETRHPQDLLRVQREKIAVPWARPTPATDTFTSSCDLWSSSPLADFGVADCAKVGGNTNISILINTFMPTSVAARAIPGRCVSGVY